MCKFGKVAAVLLWSAILVGALLLPPSDGAATREILKSKKGTKAKETAVAPAPRTCSQLESLLNFVISIPTAIIQVISNVTSEAGSGLGSLFNKGSGGIGSIFNKTSSIGGGGGGGCGPDPLILANIPGIFIGVPIVIIGIAALIAAIVAIVIAIGSGGHELRKMFEDMMGIKGGNSGGGYAPSVMSHYGTPVSAYGSPATGTPYSRLSETVDQATQDFNNAYDKYSALMTQPQQQPQSSSQQQQQSPSLSSGSGTVYFDKPSQYDGWSNHVATKRMKQ